MTSWVVVGGGSAGCVVAARLSERRDDEVTVLEAGPAHEPGDVADDVGPYIADPDRWRDDLVTRRAGQAGVAYLRGHGIAGSSLINGGVVTDPTSPSDHRLPLQDPWADGAVGSALLAADPTASRVRLIRRNDRRVDAADVYLAPALHRPNLHVVAGAEVERVLIEDRRAVGVLTSDGRSILADRVVLCAGAIHTPSALLRSGVDTPGVGDGLEDHPAFTITLRLRPGAVDPTAPTIAVAANHPTHQVLALNHLTDAPDHGALVVALTDTRSRGMVRLGGIERIPLVDLNQLSDPHDLTALTEAVELTFATLDRPAWRGLVEAAYLDAAGTPVEAVRGSTGGLREWVRGHAGGYFHAASTCRDGVVSDAGVIRGYEGLYVADASALAALPAHDPYVHVISRADKLATAW